MTKGLFGLTMLLVLAVTACSGGAVVFAPTPLPPDQSLTRYDHPSGAFSVVLPPQWALYEQNTTTLATAAFAAPGATQPALLFAAIKLQQPLDAAGFGDIITRYQTQVRSDTGRYVEQSREAMGDGSWRMTGVRTGGAGETERLNTFIQQVSTTDGTLIGLVEVLIPDDAAPMAALQSIANSFTLHEDAALQPTELTTLAYAKDSSLGILHVATWSTPSGVFFVTGEVANYGFAPVAAVPVAVALRSADGLTVLGAVDQVMGYGIPPGGFAPFSLRFGQGQPSLATTYTLTLGGAADDTNPAATPEAGAEAPVLYGQNEMTWTDESAFDSFNRLVISGTATNISSQPIRQPRAIVTVFDSAQNVIAAGYADLDAPELAPGESSRFGITLPEMGGEPENYIVSIQGLP